MREISVERVQSNERHGERGLEIGRKHEERKKREVGK